VHLHLIRLELSKTQISLHFNTPVNLSYDTFFNDLTVKGEMETQKQPLPSEPQKFVNMGIYKHKGVAVFTSGGDAQGK